MMTSGHEALQTIQPVVMKQLQTIFAKQRIAHAYIFEGQRGTGKSQMVDFFAKLLLCEQPVDNEPCENCRQCRRVTSGNHTNVYSVMRDGQYIKIDQIRDLMAEMKMVGVEAGRKIYIIYDADRLNIAAANMLLKSLEEPAGEVTAILVTEQAQGILPTIRSRCQHIKFKSVPRDYLMQSLQEQGITNSLAATVSMVTNDFQAALDLCEDEHFLTARKTVLHLIETLQQNVQEALLYIQEAWLPNFKEKEDCERALDLLLFAYRDIVALKANVEETTGAYPDKIEYFKKIALKTTYEKLSLQMQAILQARTQLQRNMNRALMMEQLMLNLQEGYTFV